MPSSALIIDNVVLSGFKIAGWFRSIGFWESEYRILVPKEIWIREFLPYHDIDRTPEWLVVKKVDGELQSNRPGALSQQDWKCIYLAENCDGILVTRDKDLKEEAENRGCSTLWSGQFLIDTVVKCGISEKEFQAGLPDYFDDAHLSPQVKDKISETEK